MYPTKIYHKPFLFMHQIIHKKLTVQLISLVDPNNISYKQTFLYGTYILLYVHGQYKLQNSMKDGTVTQESSSSSRCFYIDLALLPGLCVCWKPDKIAQENKEIWSSYESRGIPVPGEEEKPLGKSEDWHNWKVSII